MDGTCDGGGHVVSQKLGGQSRTGALVYHHTDLEPTPRMLFTISSPCFGSLRYVEASDQSNSIAKHLYRVRYLRNQVFCCISKELLQGRPVTCYDQLDPYHEAAFQVPLSYRLDNTHSTVPVYSLDVPTFLDRSDLKFSSCSLPHSVSLSPQ